MSGASRKEESKEEKLLQCSRRGDLTGVLNLLRPKDGSPGVNINCKGKSKANLGWTPLHLAAYFGHGEVVKALLENGADVNVRNGMGDTPLHRAAFTGRADLVTLLIQFGADVTIINGEGQVPRQVAEVEDVKNLIKAAEQSSQLKLEGYLLTAAREGDTSRVQEVLSLQNPPDINCRDELGNSPLHCSAYRGHKETVVVLLQRGANTSAKNNREQTPQELTTDKKMKKLLYVQPLQNIHRIVPRHEGSLLKKSRFFGWKKFWVVLERGVLSYFYRRADAAAGVKRQGFRYLDNTKFSVPKDEKHKIKIQYSDNTIQIWSIPPSDKTPRVTRQCWLNSLHEHATYSTHYTTQPTLLIDENEKDIVSLGTMQDSLKNAHAHKQLLDQLISAVKSLIDNLSESTKTSGGKGHLNSIKIKLKELAGTAGDMYSALTHCLDLLIQQDDSRRLQLEEEVEKRRVLEDALHVLATEHHALECSVGANEMMCSRMTLTSESDEFFDAMSEIGRSPPDEFLSDSDNEDSDVYVPLAENDFDEFVEPTIKKSDSEDKLTVSSPLKTRKIMTRSSSDNVIGSKKELQIENLQKTKSVSASNYVSGNSEGEEDKDADKTGYRTALPATMLSRNEFSVWTVLKQCIGRDLSRITMPVIFNEPLTFLQRIAEYMEYVHLLNKAALLENSLQRMQYVAAFALSATASNLDRVGKPFNPLLGETYELVREDMGFRLVSEQVSHHPPVSALQAEGEGFQFHVTVQPKLKFWGKGVEIQPKGMVTLKFPKHNEVYTWNNVNNCVHNIIVGQLWIEQYGQMEINNHSTGEKALLHFKPAGWFSKEVNKVEGIVFSADKKKKFILMGDWTDKLVSYSVQKNHAKEGKVLRRSSNASEMSSISVGSFNSYGSGSSNDTVETGPNSTVLWNVHKRPAHSKQMYNFTKFAIQLNELREEDKDKLAPTDSRLRPDSRAMEIGDLDLAGKEKLRLEEKQRAARKERVKLNEQWNPVWFKEEMNPYTGQMDWFFKETYWEKDFSSCPDIF